MTQGGSSGGRAVIHHQHRDVAGKWFPSAVSGAMGGPVSIAPLAGAGPRRSAAAGALSGSLAGSGGL